MNKLADVIIYNEYDKVNSFLLGEYIAINHIQKDLYWPTILKHDQTIQKAFIQGYASGLKKITNKGYRRVSRTL